MRIRGLSRLRKLWRRLRRSIVPQRGAIILCYHRIADLPQSPRRLWVSPQRFAEQLEVLTRNFVPLSLAELAKRLQEGKMPDKAVVITFDDGYADNFWNARPLLKHFGVPATVFVTTGLVGTEREFYWDELERLLLRETVKRGHGETEKGRNGETEKGRSGDIVGQKLCLELGKRTRQWKLTSDGERLKAYHEICDLLKPLSPEQRGTVLEQIRRWLGVSENGDPDRRFMTVEELATISRDGLIDIGAHTVNHPDLATLPPEQQRWEIETSKAQLEAWLSKPISWFAYPYGSGSSITRQLVKEAGFEGACSVFLGVVTNHSDSFWLPRIFVENWDGDELVKRLREV